MLNFATSVIFQSRNLAAPAFLASVAGLATAVLTTPRAQAQSIQVVAETGSQYTVGGTNWSYGVLGLPSLSSPVSSGGQWNLAVRSSTSAFGSPGNRIVFFTNSGTPQDQYSINAFDDALPTAQFNRAAYLTDPSGTAQIYSGNSPLAPHSSSSFIFGRPSAQGAFIANYEWPQSSGASGLVIHGPTGSHLLVDASASGFDDIGRVSGLNAANDVSFGRGGGANVVFRGHHATQAHRNGIYVSRYDGSRAMQTVADNNTINPLTGTTFNFSSTTPERLPVAHGAGAAWSTTDGGNAVLSKSGVGGPIAIVSQGLGVYQNVSSGGAGLLAYEVKPNTGGPTRIYQNLMGVESLAVDRTMITRRTVRDIQMGSEAVVSNARPLSNPGLGGFTLGFHASQFDPHTETAVYVKTIAQTGIDFGGRFGASALGNNGAIAEAYFSVVGGGETGTPPPDSDYVLMTAGTSGGLPASLGQEYGSGLGVNSGPGDNGYLISTLASGLHERVTITANYDMIIDAVTFSSLDVGESVRFFHDFTSFEDGIFLENPVTMMEGLQYMSVNSLYLAAGSRFTIEHGGIGDGFAINSLILTVVPTPGALTLLSLCGVLASQRRRPSAC